MLKLYDCLRVISVIALYGANIPVNCIIRDTLFNAKSDLNGKVCTESNRIFQMTARSKMECSLMCDDNLACTSVFYNSLTMVCTTCTGTSSVEDLFGTACITKQSALEGKQFKIYAASYGRFWHFDGNEANKLVTALWQPDDNYVRFMFEKQEDGSYKIKSVGQPLYIYDGFGATGSQWNYLNGNDQTDDDHMRYLITVEPSGSYRIQTKATGYYVRLDSDMYFSTRYNIKDDNSLFQLIEV